MWRSEDEMLEVVRRRAGAARDRRQAVLTGSTAALVLVAALGVATVRGGDGGGSQQVSVAAPGGERAAVTTTLAVPPASIDAPPLSTQPLPITSPTTTAAPRPTTTVARSAAATTTAPTTAAPPTTVGPPAACSPGEVAASVAATKPSYVLGEPVRVTGTLRNSSGRACGGGSYGIAFSVRDAAGVSVGADRAISALVDCIEASECTWPAGGEDSSPWCWDQKGSANGVPTPAGAGRYTIALTWTGRVTSPVTATATVDLVAPPPGTQAATAAC